MRPFTSKFRKAILQALEHDVINTAKAAAYSGMLMLFPALLVVTTLLAQVQEGSTMVGEVRTLFDQFLPADTMDLLQSYVLTRRIYSGQLLLSATGLSIFAGLGLMLSLMEGFRRAYQIPHEAWGFGGRRLRALLLVPIALVPLSVATLVIVFGHQIEFWMVENARRARAPPRGAVLLAHGAVVDCVAYQRYGACGSLPLWHEEKRALVPGGAGSGGGHAFVVSVHACFWVVCDAGCGLLNVLRFIRRRHRDAGLALHHRFQRAGWSRAEWGSLWRSPGADYRTRFLRTG